MKYFKLGSNFALIVIMASSCNSSDIENYNQKYTATPVESHMSSENSPHATSKVKFDLFNNINDVRQNLSTVGIGELGRWRNDEMGASSVLHLIMNLVEVLYQTILPIIYKAIIQVLFRL
jgi:hypothetical protein